MADAMPMKNPLLEHMQASAPPADAGDSDLNDAAQDVLDAVKSGDASHLAGALEDFFMLCDKQPHEEGPSDGGEEETAEE